MSEHTPGPWRWELNKKSKVVHLCGGRPQFDLTVLDFVRWGMGGAAVRFREDRDRLNIMHRAEAFGAVVVGREHHADWFQGIDHPDARLIEAAPELLELANRVVEIFQPMQDKGQNGHTFELLLLRAKAAIAKAQGKP